MAMGHEMVARPAPEASHGEAAAAALLAARGLAETATRIGEMHTALAGRVFGLVPGGPARLLHDTISEGVYRTVAGASRATGAVASAVLHGRAPAPLSERPGTAGLVGAINGAWGDRLERDGNPLALTLCARRDRRTVPPTRTGILAAIPEPTDRLLVLVHGLCETDEAWGPYAEPAFDARLEAEHDWTGLRIRYNTGRRISVNGRELADLLHRLERAWPVPLEAVAIVGHSMGALVARSACHLGAEERAPWAGRVRHVVSLGAPHHGAPLERLAAFGTAVLHRLPETRPLATALASRSVGIKDLRHGSLLDVDWDGLDPDLPGPDRCGNPPLLRGARHHVVSASITADPRHPLGRALGDLLVLEDSACGRAARHRHIPFDPADMHHLGGLHHFHLLRHPLVYAQLERWLAVRPQLPPG